jgi:uncharacterized lipoprotein YmbA
MPTRARRPLDRELASRISVRWLRALSVPALMIPVALSGACMGRSDPARYYVLAEVQREVGTASSARPELGVGPVTLPRYLDRANIVTRRDTELEIAEFDRWGELLSESVPRAIGANLAAQLGTERIAVFPWSGATNVEHQVIIDVIRFDGQLGGDVVLEARWRVLGRDRKELALRYSALVEATGAPGYPALVGAMSRSLAALSRQIAEVVRTLRAPSAGRLEKFWQLRQIAYLEIGRRHVGATAPPVTVDPRDLQTRHLCALDVVHVAVADVQHLVGLKPQLLQCCPERQRMRLVGARFRTQERTRRAM